MLNRMTLRLLMQTLALIATISGKVLIVGTLGFALFIPLVMQIRGLRSNRQVMVTATCVLVGGFLLRWGILTTPPELLIKAQVSRPSAMADRGFAE